MSLTAYPTLRLKLTMPQALKLQFLPAIPGSNAAAAADRAEQAAQDAQDAASSAVAATTNKVDRTGDVMSGFLMLNADPTASLHAATKHYVDILGTSGILEAPNDGALYGRQSLGWAVAQPLDGDLTSLAAATATNAIYYRSAANTWATVTIGANLTFTGGTLAATGGGGGGAPTTAEYITSTADATLSAERVLTDTASITWDRTTAGQIKANTAAGGGNVSNSGTPTAGQYGKWVTATTIQGVAVGTVLTDIGAQPLDATLTSLAAHNTNGLLTQTAADTFTGRILTGPAAGIAVTNGNGVSGNPTLALANDLAALEALAGTNNIYYRAGADIWSSVTIGSGLTFTGGTLNATGGGGNVTYTASSTAPVSPAAGDLWYDLSTGVLSIRLNDGTSSQWVMVAPPGGSSSIAAAPLDALAYNGIQFNGSMEVSQENAANVVSVTGGVNKFILDAWQLFSMGPQTVTGQQTGPAFGPFASYLRMGVTVANASPSTTDSVLIMQTLEGYRASRLAMGTASAQPVSIGFWVYSAVRTGTLTGSLRNGLGNRCCPFNVTISAAATWEYKTVTIPGDTTGTWAQDSTKGFNLIFAPLAGSAFTTAAGVWTSGNLYGAPGSTNFIQSTSDVIAITGVVILPGTQVPTAAQSALIMRPFDNELELCQRHWEKSYNYTDLPGAATNLGLIGAGSPTGTGINNFYLAVAFGTAKRAAPTVALYSGTGVTAQFSTTPAGSDSVATATATGISRKSFILGNVATATNVGVFAHYVADARP